MKVNLYVGKRLVILTNNLNVHRPSILYILHLCIYIQVMHKPKHAYAYATNVYWWSSISPVTITMILF